MISELRNCLHPNGGFAVEPTVPAAVLARSIPQALELVEEVHDVGKDVLTRTLLGNPETDSFDRLMKGLILSLKEFRGQRVTHAVALRVLLGDLSDQVERPISEAFYYFSMAPLDPVRRDEVYRLLGHFEEKVIDKHCRVYRNYSGSNHPNDFTYCVELTSDGFCHSEAYRVFREKIVMMQEKGFSFEVSCQILYSAAELDRQAARFLQTDLRLSGIQDVDIQQLRNHYFRSLSAARSNKKQRTEPSYSYTFLVYTPQTQADLLDYPVEDSVILILVSSFPSPSLYNAHRSIDVRCQELYFNSICQILQLVFSLEESDPLFTKFKESMEGITLSFKSQAANILGNTGATDLYEQQTSRANFLAETIRKKYTTENVVERFFENSTSAMDEHFVPVSLVLEEGERRNTPSDTNGLYNPNESFGLVKLVQLIGNDDKKSNRAVVWGGAGSGKSTLCHYLALSWANCVEEPYGKEVGKALGRFNIVLHITMEALSRYDKSYSRELRGDKFSLPRFILFEFLNGKGITEEDVEETLRVFEGDILFILDGFDEMESPLSRECDRIRSDLLIKRHILYTSRIEKANAFRIKNCMHIENLGFDNRQINQFIHRYFKGDEKTALSLMRYIRQNETVFDMAHTPLLLGLICLHWNMQGGSAVEFMSLTQLYTRIVSDLFRRHLESLISQGVAIHYHEQELNSVDELATITWAEIFDFDEIKKIRFVLEKLSFLTLRQQRISFKSDFFLEIMKQKFPIVKERTIAYNILISKLGFLRGVPCSNPSQREYSFIHLTFLEYFAACHLKHQRNLVDLCRSVRFVTTFRFFFGLNPSRFPLEIDEDSQCQTSPRRYTQSQLLCNRFRESRNKFPRIKLRDLDIDIIYAEEALANATSQGSQKVIDQMVGNSFFTKLISKINDLINASRTNRFGGAFRARESCVLMLRGVRHLYSYGVGYKLLQQANEGDVLAILLAGELKIRSDKCIRIMIRHLSNPEKDVRLTAVRALKWIIPEAPRHTELLKDLLHSTSKETCRAAQQVLDAISC